MHEKKAVAATLFFFGIAGLTVSFLILYCDAFYDLGIFAKDQIVLHPLHVIITTPLLFWISAYLCRRYAEGASGSSMENLELGLKNLGNDKAEKFLGIKTIIICTISSLISTFGGGSLGREGPSVQISAGIFFTAAQKLKKLFAIVNPQSWVYAGAALGLTAAFNAPIAGMVYICEKMRGLAAKDFIPGLFLATSAVFIFRLIYNNNAPLFLLDSVTFVFSFTQILLITLVAAACGLIAFIFKQTSTYFYRKFVAIKSPHWHFIPLTLGLAVALISIKYGVYAVGGGIKTVNDLLVNNTIFSSVTEVIGRIVTTILTFISGSAGGIVAPSIAIGGGIGSATIHFIDGQFASGLEREIFILSGMAAFLGATLNLPIAAAVIVLESAAQPLATLPFLLLASFVARFFMKLPAKKN